VHALVNLQDAQEYLCWERQACRQQHAWPVDGMKAQDVLANDVDGCRPATGLGVG